MDTDKIETLLKKMTAFLKAQQIGYQSGQNFNAFEMSQIGPEEMRHSAIIAALLNPRSSFGKGAEPLKAFFRQTGMNHLACLCSEKTRVYTEYAIAGRRMDIVILDDRFCVVIENKTITIDHDRQLADYRKWLNQEQSGKSTELLYLTRHGDKAMNYDGNDYKAISYENNICNWLRECALMSENPKEHAVFCAQYCEFITNVLLKENGKMDEKLFDIVAGDLESSLEVASHIDEVKALLLHNYLTPRLLCNEFIVNNNTPEEIKTGYGLDYNVEYDYPDKGYRVQFQFDHYYFWGGRIKIIFNRKFILEHNITDFGLPVCCSDDHWKIESKQANQIVLVKHDGLEWDNGFFIALSREKERDEALTGKVDEYKSRLNEAASVVQKIEDMKGEYNG